METSQHGKESTTVMDLGGLLDAGDGAVVTLEAGEARLAAHRAVLSARSPVFASMLANNSTGTVAIPDVEGRVLRLLLAFLYTLQAPQLPDVAPQLLAAADKYAVAALKDACEQQVAAQLRVETAAAAAVLAIRHSCSSLRQAAVAFIKRHAIEVMTTQGWFDAVRMHHEEMDELSETSIPPSVASGTRPPPTAQPPSGRSQSPAPATSRSTPPPDDATVSRLQGLSAEEKNRRLIEAAKQGAVGQLEALLAAGADVDHKGRDWSRRAALHWAAQWGHEEAARRLLAAGAAVDHRDIQQMTPLLWAAAIGDATVVWLLLDNRADHTATEESGWTALHWAAAGGHTEAAAALLQVGADRGARDQWGKTPLDRAMQENRQQVVDLLQGRRPPHSH